MPALKPFQEQGAAWLASKRYALLADEMRLGKSAQAITAALRAGHKRVLVLCPAGVRSNWAREFGTWAWPHRVAKLESARQVLNTDGDVAVIASYEVATSPLMLDRLRAERWDVLIADECHYLKTRGAQRTYAVYGPEGLARSAHAMWSLSGTPAPNSIAELWPLMRAYGVTDLAYEPFISAYCEVDWQGKVRGTAKEQVAALREMLAPFMLRRKKRDVMPELPEIQFVQQTVDAKLVLPKEFAHLEAMPGEDAVAWIEAHVESQSTIRRLLGFAKVAAVAEQLRSETAPDQKIIVFAEHLDVIDAMRDELDAFNPSVVTGGTPPAIRDQEIQYFQHQPAVRAFIGQIRAAGTGIDLSAASHVAFPEYSWVPSDNVQAAARAQGFAKAEPVTATFFSTPNSLDDYITRACARKANDFAAVFDGPAT